MTDYEQLVKALRDIEKTMFALGTSSIKMDNVSIRLAYDKKWGRTAKEAANAIEALNRLVDLNTERCEGLREQLRKAQEQYEKHLNELEQQLPKRGKWIEDATTYAGPGLSNYKCSLCGKICGTWRRGLEPSELPNWCGNCGADMRKMEVQDG